MSQTPSPLYTQYLDTFPNRHSIIPLPLLNTIDRILCDPRLSTLPKTDYLCYWPPLDNGSDVSLTIVWDCPRIFMSVYEDETIISGARFTMESDLEELVNMLVNKHKL